MAVVWVIRIVRDRLIRWSLFMALECDDFLRDAFLFFGN